MLSRPDLKINAPALPSTDKGRKEPLNPVSERTPDNALQPGPHPSSLRNLLDSARRTIERVFFYSPSAILQKLNSVKTYKDAETLLANPLYLAYLNFCDGPLPAPLIYLAMVGIREISEKRFEQAWSEYKKIINLYIEKGANPNVRDNTFKNTPLMWAIANAETEAALCFVQHPEVDISIGDAHSKIPLHLAVVKGYTHRDRSGGNENATPLGVVIDALLERAAKDTRIINAQDSKGNTPLHYAAVHRDIGLLEKLKNTGADITITNIQGQKPADLLNITYSEAKEILSTITFPYTILQEKEWKALSEFASPIALAPGGDADCRAVVGQEREEGTRSLDASDSTYVQDHVRLARP